MQTIKNARRDYLAARVPGAATALDVMYILTNDHGEFIDRLKETLRGDGWRTIVTSADLALDQEQIGVSMAVDMDIARQAAVFVGNGVRALLLYFYFLLASLIWRCTVVELYE